MMKRFTLTLGFLALAACDHQNESTSGSALKDETVPSFVTLICLEKQVLVDAPGIESFIDVALTDEATVSRRQVSMEGASPWELDPSVYDVKKSGQQGGVLDLSIIERVASDVDWDNEEGCYRLFKQDTYRLHRDGEGRWTGESQLFPIIKVDPAQPSCSFPHFQLPMPKQLACTEGR